MKPRIFILLLCLGVFTSLLISLSSGIQPARAESTHQNSSCSEILKEAAAIAGIDSWDSEWISDQDNPWGCEVRYCSVCNGKQSEGTDIYFKVDKVDAFQPFECFYGNTQGESPRCNYTTFHDNPARLDYSWVNFRPGNSFDWYMENEGGRYIFHVEKDIMFSNPGESTAEINEVLPLAEALWSAAEGKLNGTEALPPGSDQSNSDCAGITPDDLRAGGLKPLKCRLHCDPNTMSDDELWECINQYSGLPGNTVDNPQGPDEIIPPDNPSVDELPIVPEEELPIIPEDQTGIDQPDSLGPLATTPLIPLTGGLIGTVLGWLISVAVSRPVPIPKLSNDPSLISPENGSEKYWSERPWDVAGPGYVTKEEYDRTKDMLDKGYKWTNGGWQTPDEIHQSDQWQQNNSKAVANEEAEIRAKEKADRLKSSLPKPVESNEETLNPQQNPEGSNFGFDKSGEIVLSGDQSSSGMTGSAGIKINIYKNQYYDAKDLIKDITVAGLDIGNLKVDGQFGKVQSGAAFGYDKQTGKFSAGGFVEASTYQLTGETVIGNEYAGVTGDAQVDGPKGEAFLGYKDGSVGGSIGVSLVSGETGIGVNVANVNVGVRGGLSFGLEFGLKVGTESEIKFGPFKLGLSFGGAKTGM
jgi:hypothetical protein